MSAMRATNGKNRDAQDLIDELAEALQHHPAAYEPVIVESRIEPTENIHAVVIWDEWDDFPSAMRSNAILEAYKKARPRAETVITAAIGLTAVEALRLGFLPYSIVTTRRNADAVSLKALADAIAEARGIRVQVGSTGELRFPTREDAEDTYRELTLKIPGPYWAIVQEVSSSD